MPQHSVAGHRSLTAQAYEALKADIITCAFEPGQRIAQSVLAEAYGLGTTPIREALQRLAQEGLVQPVPRFGYIVSPITLADVHEMFELRGIVEAAAARIAAVRGPQEQLAQLRADANFTYVYQNRQSYIEFLEHNADFHRSIARAAGNERLLALVSRLLDDMTRVFHLGLDLQDSADEMRDEHVALAQALLEREPERAEQIAQDQIRRSEERVAAALVSRLVHPGHSRLFPTIRAGR